MRTHHEKENQNKFSLHFIQNTDAEMTNKTKGKLKNNSKPYINLQIFISLKIN